MHHINALISQANLFPAAYGNEEETGMQDNTDEPHVMAEPLAMVSLRHIYYPEGLKWCGDFLNNGFKIYDEASDDSSSFSSLERATPECGTPTELVRYMRGSEKLLTDIAGAYAVSTSVSLGRQVNVRIQRRVVDSRGSRKGSHDNFGYSADAPILEDFEGPPPSLLMHLASRSIRDGAGLVRPHNLHYAQKIGGLTKVLDYGFSGSMYRSVRGNGTPRMEIRCSDINISDWAAWMRIGTTALVLALNNTPLADTINGSVQSDKRVIAGAKQMNALALNEDGSLRSGNRMIWQAADFQQRCAELGMDKLQLYTDELPEEFYNIARESYRYIEDFKKILRGEETIHILADRADWAAKFALILARIEIDRSFGINRTLFDIQSQAQDLRYDNIGITAVDGELKPIRWGQGYKMRDRNILQGTIPAEQASAAARKAPQTTRAALRSDLLTNYDVVKCDWHEVRINDSGISYKVQLPVVNQTELGNFAITMHDSSGKPSTY